MQREVLRTCETSYGDKNSPPPRPAPRFFSSGIPPPLQKRMSLFCSHGFQDHRGQQTHNLLPPKPWPHNLLSSEILSRLPQRHFFLPGTGNQKISFHHLHHGGHDNVILSTFAPCNQKAKRTAFKTKLKTDVPTIALLHKKYTR